VCSKEEIERIIQESEYRTAAEMGVLYRIVQSEGHEPDKPTQCWTDAREQSRRTQPHVEAVCQRADDGTVGRWLLCYCHVSEKQRTTSSLRDYEAEAARRQAGCVWIRAGVSRKMTLPGCTAVMQCHRQATLRSKFQALREIGVNCQKQEQLANKEYSCI
jgi:hypothetical protein